MSSVLSGISQFLFELIIVSVSSIWAEILKMPFVSADKTDFVRFGVVPNVTVSLKWFAKDFGIFSGRGEIHS